MDDKKAQALANLALFMADDKAAETLDHVAYWGSSKDRGSSVQTLSEKWLKNRALSSVISYMEGVGSQVTLADVKRAETISRIADYMKAHPRASEEEKARVIRKEIEQFVRTIAKDSSPSS